jgi:hypothetical protein
MTNWDESRLGANFRSDSRHRPALNFSLWDDLQIAIDNGIFKRSPLICPYLSCLDRPPFGPRLLYLITTAWRRINPFSPFLLHNCTTTPCVATRLPLVVDWEPSTSFNFFVYTLTLQFLFRAASTSPSLLHSHAVPCDFRNPSPTPP